MAADVETQAFQPPYMSWATFESIVEQFRAVGLPAQIDRSVLRSRSGGDQSQFLRAAASFGFIDADGTPTDRFRGYVSDPESRPAVMREVLAECYANVVALPKDATPQMLIDEFRSFGIEGDTIRKAQAFYLAAARFAELPLSPHFKATRPGAGGRRSARKANGARKGSAAGASEQAAPPPPPLDPLSGLHPAIVTLVQHLPAARDDDAKPTFSTADREAWFDYAKATFNLIYEFPDGDTGGSS